MSSSQTLLITGGTGHVGFKVIVEALSKGYKVRAAVRSEAKIATIKSAESIQPYVSQLSFVVVPDITKSGAYDEALQGVDAAIHVASPLPDIKDGLKIVDLTTPAVQGTTSILYSALKQKSVKRVVITSSTAALSRGDPNDDSVITPDIKTVAPPEPYQHPMVSYMASKVLAYKATLRFIEEEKPHFTVVNLLPSYVIGKNELATTTADINNGSNQMVLGPILGHKQEAETFTSVVHLDDVAKAHVLAADTSVVKGNDNFILSYDWTADFKWNDSIAIAEKAFPDAVKKGILPLGGNIPTTPPKKYDASKAERVFGLEFKTPQEMVKDTTAYYIEVAENSK